MEPSWMTLGLKQFSMSKWDLCDSVQDFIYLFVWWVGVEGGGGN